MMTKQQFANSIIDVYRFENNLGPLDPLEAHVLRSSKVAVAMEYLGLLKDVELKDYASHRDGIITTDQEGNVLTVREVLNFLPETNNVNSISS